MSVKIFLNSGKTYSSINAYFLKHETIVGYIFSSTDEWFEMIFFLYARAYKMNKK